MLRRPLALFTIKKAVERLPGGSYYPMEWSRYSRAQPYRDKLPRRRKAPGNRVANGLEQDAAAYLDMLQDIIRELDAQSETVDYCIYRVLPYNPKE